MNNNETDLRTKLEEVLIMTGDLPGPVTIYKTGAGITFSFDTFDLTVFDEGDWTVDEK